MNDRSQPRIRLNQAWQPFTNAVPGWRMIGTVQVGAVTGALARADDGSYAQINAGHVRVLDRTVVKAAILAARGIGPGTADADATGAGPADADRAEDEREDPATDRSGDRPATGRSRRDA